MKRRKFSFYLIACISAALQAVFFLNACGSNERVRNLPFSNPAAYNSTAIPGKSLDNIENEVSINGKLPEHIYIATLTQAFAHGYEFCVSGGKIMMKKKNGSSWELFQKTGLPFSTKVQLPNTGWFLPPESITEIAADDDTLTAFDNFGRMYVCPLAKNHFDKKFAWSCGFGWPDKKQLVQDKLVENKRGWATGTRRGNIEWYTDRFGNEHHWGTMGVTTVYFLTKNGQEIRFTDSGLPADLSKTILGPERGSFIAENISASGSTLFLIDKTGTMYTRLIDYDTMGCDPMFFKYTYIAEKQPYKGSDYRSNFTRWGLPNEDWYRQPDIPLTGKAELTKYICIFQNGKGNNARVLRVAGLASDGSTGYYWKNITDKKWAFEKVPLDLPPGSFFSPDDRGRTVRGDKNEYTYRGILMKDNTAVTGISCSIDDMTLTSEGSCSLKITKGNETKVIPLYLVEMWTFMTRYDPVFDNTPKSFFVTPHFSEKNIRSSDSDFNAILSVLFEGKNLELFSVTATATGSYLAFNFDKKDTVYTIALQGTGRSTGSFAPLVPSTSSKKEDDNQWLDTTKLYTPADIAEINKTADANRRKIHDTEEKIKKYKEEAAVTDISRWGYNIADTLAAVTLLKQVDMPKIKTITTFGGKLMTQNADNFHLLSEYKSFEYPYEIQLAENTIRECTALKKRLENKSQTQTDNLFRNSYPGYFSLINLPQETLGTLFFGQKKVSASIQRIDSEEKIPVLLLEYGDTERRQYILIEFSSLIPDVQSYLKTTNNRPNENRTFTTAVIYRILSWNSPLFGKKRIQDYITSKEGIFTWDGKTMYLSLLQSQDKQIPLFISRNTEVSNDN
ncbi:MAG: hypothetical protein M0P01_06490 [Treponema sp.]|nr:hypothetical protein [Treponema sp.]